MTDTASIENFTIGSDTIQLYVPNPVVVQQYYRNHLVHNGADTSPYWSQVWPAAIGLCRFLTANTDYIKDKLVVELAAGLGLPSLFAAKYASKVFCSDYIVHAVELIKKSITINRCMNVEAAVINWNHLPASLHADVLLLSDINYDTADFEDLHNIVVKFLQNGSTIIISTPQRLMAKPFADKLLPYCIDKKEFTVSLQNRDTSVTVFVLKK